MPKNLSLSLLSVIRDILAGLPLAFKYLLQTLHKAHYYRLNIGLYCKVFVATWLDKVPMATLSNRWGGPV